jgi:mono/diheme cytochrome c family protein
MKSLIISLLTLALLTGCQCSRSNDKNSATAIATTGASGNLDLIARGKVVYLANCITCHNSNPRKPGSLGPDVAGSSKELLIARIVHGKYPDGYTPKRSSHVMQALPHLVGDIDALVAYLNAP